LSCVPGTVEEADTVTLRFDPLYRNQVCGL